MPVIKSKLKTDTPLYTENYSAMSSLVNQLNFDIAKIKMGGGEKSQERQRRKGKNPVRERIIMLLDDGSPFLEVGMFAAWNVYDDDIACAGAVAGIGEISGINRMIIANDLGERRNLLPTNSKEAPSCSRDCPTL